MSEPTIVDLNEVERENWSEFKAGVLREANADPRNTAKRDELAKEAETKWEGGYDAVIGIYAGALAKAEPQPAVVIAPKLAEGKRRKVPNEPLFISPPTQLKGETKAETTTEAKPASVEQLVGHFKFHPSDLAAPKAESWTGERTALVATEAKKRALVKFNPVKNPYNQNGFENAGTALDVMEFDCRLDLFHNKPIIQGKHAWLGGDGFEDIDNVVLKLRQLINGEFGFDPGKAGTLDALRVRCLDQAFDPVLNYLDSVKWDGRSRLDRWLIDYATADDTPLNRAFGRKVLMAAVRRAKRPGCKFDYLLVLEGEQGIGKSTLVLILAGEDFYSDKAIIGCDAREQQESIQGVWLYEVAELEGLSKVDMNWMKMFLSRTHDKARPAFGRNVVNRPRRGIMIGTTNDDTYLRDTTGNRRWWPVTLHGRIKLSELARDRDQLWAEAVAAEAMDEPLVIPESLWGAAAIEQHARVEVDAWEEPIAAKLGMLEAKRANLEGCFSSKDADKNCVSEFRVSSGYLLGEVLGISENYRAQRETKRLAGVMRTLGWRLAHDPIKVGKKTCRAYVKPQS